MRDFPEEFSEYPDDAEDSPPADGYTPPLLIPLGTVRQATKGSSSSGTADANSQFYW